MRQSWIIVLALSLICALPVRPAAAQAIPAPAELIQKMSDASAKPRVLVAKGRATATEGHARVVKFDEGFREMLHKYTIDIATDGRRFSLLSYRDDTTDGKEAPKTAYSRFLWDGALGLRASANVDQAGAKPLKMNAVSFSTNALMVDREKASNIHSFFWGRRDVLSFVEILRNSDHIELAKALEPVDGAPCYHVIADGRYGHHELWIDPAADYNIRKALVTRKSGDKNRVLTARGPIDQPMDKNSDPTTPVVTSSRATFDKIKLANIAGVWMPSHYRIQTEMDYNDGGGKQTSIEMEIEFTPNPDFELMGTFKWQIPEGMRMVNMDPPGGSSYVYHNGNIVALTQIEGQKGTPGQSLIGPPRK